MADGEFSIKYNVDADLKPIKEQLSALGKVLVDLQKKFSKSMSPEDAAKAEAEIQDLVKSIKTMEKATSSIKLDDKLKSSADAANKTSGSMDKLGGSTSGLKGKMDGLADTFSDIIPGGDALTGVLGKLGPMGTAALAGIAALTAGIVKLSEVISEGFDNLAQFEAGLGQVSTLLDREQEAEFMGGFNQQIRELAVQSGETFDNLTKGLYDLISAGIPASEAMETLTLATQAAQAGATDTSVAVDGLTTAMNAMGLTSEEVGDILFTTVRLGKTTFEELSSSLGAVLPSANAAKVSLEEVGAAMSAMTARGISTSEASTALNALIREFTNPETIKRFEQVGIQVNDAITGELRNLGDILTDVMEKEFSNIEYGQLITSDEAKKSFLTLVQEGENSAGETVSIMESVFEQFNPEAMTGALSDAYSDMADQIIIQQERINRSYEVFTMELGEIFRPLESAWMDVKANVFEGLASFFEGEGTSHIKRFIEDTISALKSFGQTAINIFDTIGLDTLTQKIGTHLETFISLVEEIRDFALNLQNIFEGLTDWTSQEGNEISKFFDVLIDTIMMPFDLLDGLFSLLDDGIEELNVLLGGTENIIGDLDEEIKSVGETLNEELADLEKLENIEVKVNAELQDIDVDETTFEALQEIISETANEFPELAARMEEVANSSDTLEEKQKALKEIFEEMKGAQEGVIDEQATQQLERQAEAVSLLASETENWTEEIDDQGQGLTEVHQRLEDIAGSVADGLISQEDALTQINNAWGDQETKAEAIAYLQRNINDLVNQQIITLSEQTGINENVLRSISNQKTVYNQLKTILGDINEADRAQLILKYQQLRMLAAQLRTETDIRQQQASAYLISAGVTDEAVIQQAQGKIRDAYNRAIFAVNQGMQELARLSTQTIEEMSDSLQESGHQTESTLERQIRLMREINGLLSENATETYQNAENADEVREQYRSMLILLNKIKSEYGGTQGTITDVLNRDIDQAADRIQRLSDQLPFITDEMVEAALAAFPEQRQIDALINYILQEYKGLYEGIGEVSEEINDSSNQIEETFKRSIEYQKEQYNNLLQILTSMENEAAALERLNVLKEKGIITDQEKLRLQEAINAAYETYFEKQQQIIQGNIDAINYERERNEYVEKGIQDIQDGNNLSAKELEIQKQALGYYYDLLQIEELTQDQRYTLYDLKMQELNLTVEISEATQETNNQIEETVSQTELVFTKQDKVYQQVRRQLSEYENIGDALSEINKLYNLGLLSETGRKKLIKQANQLLEEQNDVLEETESREERLARYRQERVADLSSEYQKLLDILELEENVETLTDQRTNALALINELRDEGLITAEMLEKREAQINEYFEERIRLRQQDIQQVDEIANIESQLADAIEQNNQSEINRLNKIIERREEEEQIQNALEQYREELERLNYEESVINDRLADRAILLRNNLETEKKITTERENQAEIEITKGISPGKRTDQGVSMWADFFNFNDLKKELAKQGPELVNEMAQQAASDFGKMFGKAIAGDEVTYKEVGQNIGGMLSTGIKGLAAATGNPLVAMAAEFVGPVIEQGFGKLFEALQGTTEIDKWKKKLEEIKIELHKQTAEIEYQKRIWNGMSSVFDNTIKTLTNQYDSARDQLNALNKEAQKFSEWFEIDNQSIENRIEYIDDMNRKIARYNRDNARDEELLMKTTNKRLKKELEYRIEGRNIQINQWELELENQQTALDYQKERRDLEHEITQEKYKQLQLEESLTDVTTKSISNRLAESYRLLTESINQELGSEVINENLKTFTDNLREALAAGIISDQEYQDYQEKITGIQQGYIDTYDTAENTLYQLRTNTSEALGEILSELGERGLGGEIGANIINQIKKGAEQGFLELGGEKITFSPEAVYDAFTTTLFGDEQLSEQDKNFAEALRNYADFYGQWFEKSKDFQDMTEMIFDADLLSETFTASYDELLIGRFNALERRIQEQRNLLAIAEKAGMEEEAAQIQEQIVSLLQDQIDLIGERGDDASSLIGFMEQQGFLEEDIYEWLNKRLGLELELTNEQEKQTEELEKQNDEMGQMSEKLRNLLKQRQNLELQAVEAGMWTPAQLAQYQMLTSGIISEMNVLGMDTSGEQSRLIDIPHYQTGGYVPDDTLAMLHAGEFVLNPTMVDQIRGVNLPDTNTQYNNTANNATFNTNIVLEMDGIADVDRMRDFLENEAANIVQSGLRQKGLSFNAIS